MSDVPPSEELKKKYACPPKERIELKGYDVKIEVTDNNYKPESKDEEKANNNNNNEEQEASFTINITFTNKSTKSVEFKDELVIRHQHPSFLLEVVRTLYACFSKKAIENGFITHNKEINSFSFSFESQSPTNTQSQSQTESKEEEPTESSQLLSCIRTLSLPRKKYTRYITTCHFGACNIGTRNIES